MADVENSVNCYSSAVDCPILLKFGTATSSGSASLIAIYLQHTCNSLYKAGSLQQYTQSTTDVVTSSILYDGSILATRTIQS